MAATERAQLIHLITYKTVNRIIDLDDMREVTSVDPVPDLLQDVEEIVVGNGPGVLQCTDVIEQSRDEGTFPEVVVVSTCWEVAVLVDGPSRFRGVC